METKTFIIKHRIDRKKRQHTGDTDPWAFKKIQMAATNEILQIRMRKPLPLKYCISKIYLATSE